MPCTGGDDDRPRFIAARLADDGLDITVHDLCHRVHVDLRAQRHGLLQHPLGKLIAADFLKTGIVFQLGREGDLPAKGVLFQHQDGFSRTAGINGGGQPGRSGAHNDNIVHSLPHFAGNRFFVRLSLTKNDRYR